MKTNEKYAVCSKIAEMFDVKPFTNLVLPKKQQSNYAIIYSTQINTKIRKM